MRVRGGRHLGTLGFPEGINNCAFGGEDYHMMLIAAKTSVYGVLLTSTEVRPPGARALQ